MWREKHSDALCSSKLFLIILIVFTKRETRYPQKDSSLEETYSQFEITLQKKTNFVGLNQLSKVEDKQLFI